MSTLAIACMKNEGPFVIEWLAHHRAIGVGDFLVFSNDCTDGTAELLDALDEAGVLTHLENPNCLVGADQRINVAFDYAGRLRPYRRAEHVLLIDVDEFVTVHAGDGTLDALRAAAGPFDVLSMSHVNFGFCGVERFEDAPLAERFLTASGEAVGAGARTRTAVKSMHRTASGALPFNHFPTIAPADWEGTVWLDGSGARLAIDPAKPRRKMLKTRGRTRLAQINHYALRSVDSFLVKHDRGNVFGTGRVEPLLYASEYGHGAAEDRSILRMAPKRRAETAALMALPGIAAAHAECVARHAERIRALRSDPEVAELRRELIRRSAPEPVPA